MANEVESTQDVDIYASRGREYRFIQLETANDVARLTLKRPPANVLSVEMLEDLNHALETLAFEPAVKLVVLSAVGQYFSAGFELADHVGDRAYLMLDSFKRAIENLLKIDRPVLAVVKGSALGAGSLLVAGCDMALAASSVRLGFPEIKGGVFNTVAVALLPRLCGAKRAFDLIMSGASVTAADAERLGLITRAVPDEKLQGEAEALIQRFQETSGPILRLTRKAITGGLHLSFGEAVAHAEDVYLNHLLATEDVKEGLRAIAEKRKPAWKDR
jgi:cyclohexa-1,5-dienecarbonyl-CoA hydratase